MRSGIVVMGSLNADFVTRLRRFPAPGETVAALEFAVHAGGKGANQAYAAARLRGRVSMIGRVGSDTHGERLRQSLVGAGVDVTHVRSDAEAPTGMALIALDETGQNQIVIVGGANGRLTPESLEPSLPLLAAAAIVMLQLEVPLESVEAAARAAKAGGALVVLDPAPARSLPDSLLACVDYLTPNETELLALLGRPSAADPEADARVLLERGARHVIVKRGEAGALLVGPDQQLLWPAVPVAVVDTTGAGDAFNAGLAVALAEGQPLAEAGRLAAGAGALCVTRSGAQPSMPTREEVDALLSTSLRARGHERA